MEKKNLENFGKFLEFYGKLRFFETIPITTIAQNSRIYKFEEKKKIILRFSGEKSSEKTEMML